MNRASLLLDLVDPIAGLSLRGLDLEAMLLGGGREEAPDRMFLPAVTFIISARLAPLGRPISSRIFAPLLSARGVLAFSLARAAFAGFLPALASFFGEASALPPLAGFWPLGAPRPSSGWHPSSGRPSPAQRVRPVPRRWRCFR
jgi:hypothetical protein